MAPNQVHQFGDDMRSTPQVHSHAQNVVPHLTLHPGMMKTGARRLTLWTSKHSNCRDLENIEFG